MAIAIAALALAGMASLSGGFYLYAKAQAGQWLLHRAWSRSQASDGAVAPWPWADTHPVARLYVPGQDVDLLILAGASGRTLAWGPGHLDDSALPGADGHAVVSGHRDTHFRFLETLARGDAIVVEAPGGTRREYRVRDIRVADAGTLALPRETAVPTLTLVTCYPFDAVVPGGPQRYVVTAEAALPQSRAAAVSQPPERTTGAPGGEAAGKPAAFRSASIRGRAGRALHNRIARSPRQPPATRR